MQTRAFDEDRQRINQCRSASATGNGASPGLSGSFVFTPRCTYLGINRSLHQGKPDLEAPGVSPAFLGYLTLTSRFSTLIL